MEADKILMLEVLFPIYTVPKCALMSARISSRVPPVDLAVLVLFVNVYTCMCMHKKVNVLV